MTTIYHNPRCSKSRLTLTLLEEKGEKPDIILYLDNPPSTLEIKEIISKLGFSSPRDLMRTKEDIYKEMNLGNADLSDEALIDAIATKPKLLERPIVIKGKKAAIGRPPENVLSIL